MGWRGEAGLDRARARERERERDAHVRTCATHTHTFPPFPQPDNGRILIDGNDVTTLPVAALRRHMTLVQQEPVLFGVSIRDNVCYGCPAGATDEQVEEACRQANAHGFISGSDGFPEGYLTLVGERGVRLSGGQKQRIAIARALILQVL